MTKLAAEQIARHAHDAGFRGQALTIAVAVALAESSGDTKAHNKVPPDNSYGLWQINMLGTLGPARREEYDLKSNAQLFDPAANAKAAYAISHHGKSFTAWSTYTNGKYREFLATARKAAQSQSTKDETRPRRDGHQGDGHRIVLDLAELRTLAQVFQGAATRVTHTRRAVRQIAADVESAQAALSDKALATLIFTMFATLDAPTQLAAAAERLDRQGDYAERVRRLAEEADGGDTGWSKADRARFLKSVGKEVDPFERAVKEALLSGSVVRGPHRTKEGHNPARVDTAGLTNGRIAPSKLSSVGDGEKMLALVAAQFRRMDAAACAAGLDLRVNSGYRTRDEQARLYDAYVHGRGSLAARPGHSTHGLGLSADINVTNPNVLAWLRKHAGTYGFVNDVPSEPWHWTYHRR